MNKKSVSITGISQPPPKDRVSNSMFIDDIMDHLTSILPITQRNLIFGDFNIHVDDVQDNDTISLSDTMMVLGLNRCVNSNMHVHSNKLELVFAKTRSDLTVSSCTTGIFILHHKLVTATLNIRKPKLERKLVTMRR